jgi:microcin C transport system permease protein
VQGYFGGRTDLIFQRMLEIWGDPPTLYVIIILFAILGRSFWLLVGVSILFGWPALWVVRAEFLRARNFEYVRAARALGVSDRVIMFRHILPNAMVATLTMLPFIVTGHHRRRWRRWISWLWPAVQPRPPLGELTLQAKQNLQAPWLAFTAFFTFAIMLSLLVFIFEGVRDAFDPRKTFRMTDVLKVKNLRSASGRTGDVVSRR